MASRRFAWALCVALGALLALSPTAQAKGPSVTRELERMRDAGQITPEDAGARRAAYTDAVKTVRKLSGARRAELGGVVADLQGMAARGQLTPSRLPALWLTLQSNVQWWTTSPLLANGARISFPGSDIVWQEYAGHGIQLQWLATFGRLNALWTGGKRYDARAGKLIDDVLPLAAARAGGIAWEYEFPFDGQSPPWVSSLAQGTGLQALARSTVRLGRQAELFPVLKTALGIFQTPPPEGVRVARAGGAHYLQYSGLPDLRILNGFIQSLVGLYDYSQLTGDPEGQALFAAGNTDALEETPTFDTGAWSLYSRGSSMRESDLSYHVLLRDFLKQLCGRTGAPAYCSAAQHFTAYLTQPPLLTPLAGSVRAKRAGYLRFRLSKLSTVSVRVVRGTRVALSRGLGLVGHGKQRVRFTAPKASGNYTITYTVRDVAGNAGTATGTLVVTKAKKKQG